MFKNKYQDEMADLQDEIRCLEVDLSKASDELKSTQKTNSLYLSALLESNADKRKYKLIVITGIVLCLGISILSFVKES